MRLSDTNTTDVDARFSSLFLTFHADVLGYCVRRSTRSAGDDLAAEVFAVAWRRIDDLDWDTARPWLFGIARGVLANHYRSRARWMRLSQRVTGNSGDLAESPEIFVIRQEQDREVIQVLASLKPGDREVLMLSAWEGLTGPEIGVALSISTSAAEQRLHRAKRRFAERLQRTGAPKSLGAVSEGGGR